MFVLPLAGLLLVLYLVFVCFAWLSCVFTENETATKSSISLWAFIGTSNGENNLMEKILELDAPNVAHLAFYEPYLGTKLGEEPILIIPFSV